MEENTKLELKKESLELAEDITTDMIEHVFSFAKKVLSKNSALFSITPFLDTIKEFLLKQADKIDGQKSNV